MLGSQPWTAVEATAVTIAPAHGPSPGARNLQLHPNQGPVQHPGLSPRVSSLSRLGKLREVWGGRAGQVVWVAPHSLVPVLSAQRHHSPRRGVVEMRASCPQCRAPAEQLQERQVCPLLCVTGECCGPRAPGSPLPTGLRHAALPPPGLVPLCLQCPCQPLGILLLTGGGPTSHSLKAHPPPLPRRSQVHIGEEGHNGHAKIY